jgi:hypothetical protein
MTKRNWAGGAASVTNCVGGEDVPDGGGEGEGGHDSRLGNLRARAKRLG